MQLKNLDICGFKSFPERTRIDLVNGVTAIVGPNGCGKTNILDALRWVMGEQRPTLLRGGKMEDVIFNGSQKMKPQGMAEVTLTIENTRGVLPTEYNELQITRRLFRSGESEYLLNRTPCRLRDITDLFADTGMGANAYSVIQQHMIDSLISDKTEDRRILFEEAAGITKYKQRKRAALRKLDSTENDLSRLHDILSEVKTQVNSLNRQMKKAERYQKTHLELKHLELSLATVTLKALESEAKEQRLDLEKQKDLLTGCDTELASAGATVETERSRQNEIDSELSEATRTIQGKTEEGHRIDLNISALRERIGSLGSTRERNLAEIAACDARLQQLETEEASLKEDLLKREATLGESLAEIAQAQNRSHEADRNLLSSRQVTEGDTEKLMSLEGRISSGKTDTHNLSEQETELSDKLTECSAKLSELAEKISATERERATAQAELSESEAKIDEFSRAMLTTNEEIEAITEKLEIRSDQITDLSSALEATQTRIRLLEEMIEGHEGFGAGVSAALDNKQSWPDLLGAVAEVVSPNKGYGPAIEAALDDVAGYLVVEKRSTAKAIISYLTLEQKGRAVVFALEGLNLGDNDLAHRRPLEETGFVGWADRLIQPDQRIASLARTLLYNTVVFESSILELPETEFDALLARLPETCQLVTTDGRLFRGLSTIGGGSEDGLPRFGRRERIDELTAEFENLQSDLDQARSQKNSETADIARLRARLSATETELDSAREAKSASDKRAAEIGARLSAQNTDKTRIEKEKTDAGAKLEVLKNRQYSLSLDVDQLATEKETLLSALNERTSTLRSLEEDAQNSAERLNSMQVKLVESKSHIQQLTDRIQHQQELRSEINQTRESKISENQSGGAEVETSKEKISEFEEALKVIFAERGEYVAKEVELREKRDEINSALRRREGATRDIRSRREQAQSAIHSADLSLAQIDNDRSNILKKIVEDYEIDLSQTPYVKEPIEGDSESTSALDTPEARLQVRENVDLFKQKLKSYGPVNLLAIDEYGSATERFTYLSAQLEDLTQAKATLQSTINKINRTAKELFIETFATARRNFKDIFTELFDGGECDLLLADDTDPLESEIIIIAKPKGKKLVTITQMSGGERALTAISLLFSLYLVKPSPFCILDEIDAPLDDANCHRFLRLIRRFSNQTQFIVITHNKITMEAADTLYGVTMESPGISKLVSVRFDDPGESGDVNVARLKTTLEAELEPIAQTEPDVIEIDAEELEAPAVVLERLKSNVDIPEEAPTGGSTE